MRYSLLACAVVLAFSAHATDDILPNTHPLTLTGEFPTMMLDGAHRFVERKIAESLNARQKHWHRNFSSPDAYEKSIADNRRRFLKIIGVVDIRLPPAMEKFGDASEDRPSLVAETNLYRVYQVRWDVLPGVHGEGLLVEPTAPATANIIALPDADETPEQLLGLSPGLAPEQQFALRLAQTGRRVLIPTLIDRSSDFPGHPDVKNTAKPQTDREWIYRQAFQLGRHVIGYEVQKVLAAVDYFHAASPTLDVIVAGHGEGGLIAFYSAAADPRITAAYVGGYFSSRQSVWSEPIYRNVWGLLEEFGDAEIATLIAPRPLTIVYGHYPEVKGDKGDLTRPPLDEVRQEFNRIGSLLKDGFQKRDLIESTGAHHLADILAPGVPPQNAPVPTDLRKHFDPKVRQGRQVRELEAHVQHLLRASDHERSKYMLYKIAPSFTDEKWTTALRFDTIDPAKVAAAAEPYRDEFRREILGQFDEPYADPNPRSRKLEETDKWTRYDVVLQVWPEFWTHGVLLVPKDIKPNERRPIVVCQHGRQGQPKDVIDKPGNAYNQFAAKLADQGFITFAPQNLHYGEDRYRWLSRKANGVKASLFSFIVAQHEVALNFLATLPFVDKDRIAFYGLSYGGETAMRVPACLKGYCLSICSGDFNQWTEKVASTDERFSFMYSIEWEMYYFNMSNTFDYAEMAYLIFPRPFMVERGHHDQVGRDRWVAYEYAKVKNLYDQTGLSDRTAFEYFNGGHAINAEVSFDFLHKHLNWPQN